MTSVKSNTATVNGTSTPPNFELTPLSGLIKQSYKDIETLKVAHKARARVCEEAGPSTTPELGVMIDFDKVEENLRRFEELYRSVGLLL